CDEPEVEHRVSRRGVGVGPGQRASPRGAASLYQLSRDTHGKTGTRRTAGTMEPFSSRSLALRVEKKLLSEVAGRSVARLFIDETGSEVLDELYRVSKEYTCSRAQAQRVIKDLIKVAVKVAVLHRSGSFGPGELDLAARFRQKLRQGAMTALSFGEVAFTFEAAVLAGLLTECRDMLLELVQRHLTPKSHGRIHRVFDHFSDPGLLTALYGPGFTLHLGKICDGLRKLLDEGKL
ncbi:hypothetical protein MC885_020238, partial [Smutsia gigantea]